MTRNPIAEIAERRALFMSIGTRGDMEPVLTAALTLRSRGWKVYCLFPDQFRSMVEEIGIPFFGLDKRFLELIEGESGKTIMGRSGGPVKRIMAMRHLISESKQMQSQLLEEQKEAIEKTRPHRIIHHPKCIYPYLYEINHPGTCIQLIPLPGVMHPIEGYSSIAFRGVNYGKWINRLSYSFVNFTRALMLLRFTKKVRGEMGLENLSRKRLDREMMDSHEAMYPISPTLVRPDWPEHVHLTGYHERDKGSEYSPSSELTDFLAQHEKVVLLTFGSMINDDPEEKTRIFIEIFERLKITALINTSWGGLKELKDVPDHVLFVHGIPYDWAFPRVYAVIHHGGSGTTHTACKYGCPSLVIPHIVDQFFWNQTIARLGLGPLGPAINKVKRNKLTALVKDLFENEDYKFQAESIAKKMAEENLDDLYIQCLEGATL